MFVTSYSFQKVKITEHDPLNPHLVSLTLYRFDTHKGNRYLVEVHEHDYKVFAVKFYLKKDRNNKKKYNILTNNYEWGGVFRTIFDICLHLHNKEHHASFAFVGAYKISSKKSAKPPENKYTPNNQRFRIYSKMTWDLLGEDNFEHFKSEELNCYLLLNRKRTGHSASRKLIIQKMCNAYPELGVLTDPISQIH